MPIYEYSCKKCSEEFEILHKVDEKPKEPCPACGSRAIARKISAAGFRLTGGGWYETDFKSGAKKNVKEKETAPAAAPAPTASDKAPAQDRSKGSKKADAPAKTEPAKAAPAKASSAKVSA